jgi:hypothetical protein
MKNVVVNAALAGLSLSMMVIGLAALGAGPEPQRAIAVPSADISATQEDSLTGWPAPSAPFDETPITPIESAGAPMFP